MFFRVRQLAIPIIALIVAGTTLSAVAVAASVLQSYGSDLPLQPGILVELEPKNSSKVEPLTQTSASKMFGVVVNPNASPVSLSNTNGSGQTYVATSGTAEVLVSNQNGAISSGDYVTISSLDGIGMKAGTSDDTVIGKATTGFDGSNALGTTTLKNSSGQQKTVALGQVVVNIAIGHNPLVQSSQVNLPGFLRRAGQSVSNRPLSPARAYLGLAIIIISAIIAGSLLYAGVRSSITAIGRNPLSKKSIFRSLIQVTITSLIVFIVGLFAVYLLLRY